MRVLCFTLDNWMLIALVMLLVLGFVEALDWMNPMLLPPVSPLEIAGTVA